MKAVVIGASGGVGGALVELLAARDEVKAVHALSRAGRGPIGGKVVAGRIDIVDEESVAAAQRAVDISKTQYQQGAITFDPDPD